MLKVSAAELGEYIENWAAERFLSLRVDGSSYYNFNWDEINEVIRKEGSAEGLTEHEINLIAGDVAVNLRHLDEVSGDISKKSDAPPAPTTPPGEGFEWALNTQTNTWFKKTKTASILFEKPNVETQERLKQTSRFTKALKTLQSRGKMYDYLDKLTASLDFEKLFAHRNWVTVAAKKDMLDIFENEKVCGELEVDSKVSRMGSTHTGKIIKVHAKNNSYQVRWTDGTESTHWKQELLKEVK